MRKINKCLVWVTLLLCSLSCASAFKFLGVFPSAERSHYLIGVSLMKELARRGHQVTVISPFPLEEPLDNFVDVPLESVIKTMKSGAPNLLHVLKLPKEERSIFSFNVGIAGTIATLEDPNVQELMRSNQTFDAVICEVYLFEALYGFSEYFKAPLIGYSPISATKWNSDMVGSPVPLSYVPSPFQHYTDRMKFTQRLGNMFHEIVDYLLYETFFWPKQVKIYKKHFPNLERSLDDVRRNAALVLVNTHVSISFPRPYLPNHIEVGGMHINRNRTPLPEDIRKFIEEAPDGVIYFSMGSLLTSATLTLAKREVILKTFIGLKQRVLWKFDNAKLEGIPDNVLIRDWFPQQDILAHDNVVAFITHGSLLSITEGIYYGKPFIGIPILGDQLLNMARAVSNGYAIMLDYETLSSETFKRAIYRITFRGYSMVIQEISARYRDQPMLPLDLAAYWVEHVARHRGAKYLHCACQDVSFWVYYDIDVLIIVALIVVAIFSSLLSVALYLLKFVYKYCR